jgi:hypothetical protein
MKLKLFAVALSCVFLTACNDREGTLTVGQNLMLNSKKGMVSVPAGVYQAKIEKKRGDEIQLEIKAPGRKIEVNFDVADRELAAGDIFVPASRSGLGYDVAGTRNVSQHESAVRRTTRTCYPYDNGRYYPGYYPGCRYDDPFCDPIFTRTGRQEVVYQDVITTDVLDLDLMDNGRKAASFHSTEVSTNRRTLDVGTCW